MVLFFANLDVSLIKCGLAIGLFLRWFAYVHKIGISKLKYNKWLGWLWRYVDKEYGEFWHIDKIYLLRQQSHLHFS